MAMFWQTTIPSGFKNGQNLLCATIQVNTRIQNGSDITSEIIICQFACYDTPTLLLTDFLQQELIR